MNSFVTAQNRFGLALLRQLASQEPRANVFLSPLGVAAALHLALDGAAGATREALAATLQVSAISATDLGAAVATQLRALIATEEDESASAAPVTEDPFLMGLAHPGRQEPMLTLANAVWADEYFSLAPAYVAQLRQRYQAEAHTLDFAAPDAATTINNWVSQHTQGRITQLVTPELLQQRPPLLLANAVYFKARWLSAFEPEATQPGRFTLADGRHQQVPLMQQRSTTLGYQQGPGWQAVQLPYQGQRLRLSMQLFVPDQPTGLPDFLATLTAESWAAWQAAFAGEQPLTSVHLTMPRFRLEWERDLTSTLATLGLEPALGVGANFTSMGFAAEAGGFIGSIAHKTFLAVDETGTEAAAVTVMMMAGGMPPRPTRQVTMRVDHPFFCAIVDDRTGSILFSGAIYEPDASS